MKENDTIYGLYGFIQDGQIKDNLRKMSHEIYRIDGSRDVIMFIEKIQELNIEILKFIQNSPNENRSAILANIAEELADCLLCIRALQYVCRIPKMVFEPRWEPGERIGLSHLSAHAMKEIIEDGRTFYATHIDSLALSAMETLCTSGKKASKYMRSRLERDEFADCLLDAMDALHCLQLCFGIRPERIELNLIKKIERLKTRIENGDSY